MKKLAVVNSLASKNPIGTAASSKNLYTKHIYKIAVLILDIAKSQHTNEIKNNSKHYIKTIYPPLYFVIRQLNLSELQIQTKDQFRYILQKEIISPSKCP